MKRHLLVIYDLDIGYAEGLLARLNQRNEVFFEVKQITELESLNEFCNEVELLLLDENLKGIEINSNVKRVMYLSEGRQDAQHVNRYQSIDEILIHINAVCQVSEKVNIKKESKTEIIGVYSPIGGCGKTVFATELGGYVSNQGGQAFYFDFGLISNAPSEENADFFYDMHEKLLFVNEDWKHYFIFENGVYRLRTSFYNCQLWNMREDDMTYLLHGLRAREETAYYVFDIGFINQAVITLLKECDYWVLPYKIGEAGQTKVQNLKELLKFSGEEGLLQKIIEADMEQPRNKLLEKLVS